MFITILAIIALIVLGVPNRLKADRLEKEYEELVPQYRKLCNENASLRNELLPKADALQKKLNCSRIAEFIRVYGKPLQYKDAKGAKHLFTKAVLFGRSVDFTPDSRRDSEANWIIGVSLNEEKQCCPEGFDILFNEGRHVGLSAILPNYREVALTNVADPEKVIGYLINNSKQPCSPSSTTSGNRSRSSRSPS